MARSFFERLTGSVRVSEDEAEAHAARPAAVSSARRTKPAGPAGERRVLHPTAEPAENAAAQVAGEAEPSEEGQLTVDIYDDGADIVIQSTMAGVKPDDIDISLQDDTLIIRGSRKRSHEVSDESFYYRELYWGTFSRSIILPEEVDFQKAEAALKHGFLSIRLPKKDRGEKKLRVKAE